MTKQFIKDRVIKTFEISGEKVLTTIILGGFKVTNPTLDKFKSIGWEEYIIPEPEPIPEILPTIEELVEQKLRERYSINQEFEVQRKRDIEPNEFQIYYDYVEECIAWAKEQGHRDRD